MTPQLGDTAYGDGQRLVCGAPGEYEGSVEACFLSDDTAETDANYIADRIETMVSSGEPVRDGGTTRPVQYEDCCVLLAARGDFPAYAEALTARGIPVYADARENLLDAPHIRPLIALLRVIDNPAQDIPLAAVLLSPMFPYTADDLVALRRARPTGSLYGAVLYSEPQRFAFSPASSIAECSFSALLSMRWYRSGVLSISFNCAIPAATAQGFPDSVPA